MLSTKKVSVLIPTFNRIKALAVTLTSLYYQEESDFDIIISDQSDHDRIFSDQSVQTAIRLLRMKGHPVRVLKNLPALGMAQQRQFLFEQCSSDYALFLDDDVILESYVIGNLLRMIQREGCGFIGSAVIGLSYATDFRPHQQRIEFWDAGVQPERIIPRSEQWNRYEHHNAANIFHIEKIYGVTRHQPRLYKVAWVGGCVMYDKKKLEEAGAFSFWVNLPKEHCGEDVLAQLRVMQRFGGCGILPSGVYHQELETTVRDRKVNAPEVISI